MFKGNNTRKIQFYELFRVPRLYIHPPYFNMHKLHMCASLGIRHTFVISRTTALKNNSIHSLVSNAFKSVEDRH